MSLNLSTILLIKEELCAVVIGMRVCKVHQPARDLVVLSLRGDGNNIKRLLISVSNAGARVHLTEHIIENPAAPPMFCMLLRKYLTGARIEKIIQPPSERILEIVFKTSSAMGDVTEVSLLTELFGRIPNIILINKDRVIIDCLRRISGDTNAKRLILPGLKYLLPEIPSITAADTPEKAKENCNANDYQSISQMLDDKYTDKSVSDSMYQKGSALIKIMKTAHRRVSRKTAAQKTELEQTGNRDYIRECGDIIMANLHNIKKGDAMLIADDFYAGGGKKREIVLDVLKTPQKNAAKYYKDYTKARNAVEHLTKQIAIGEQELCYIDSVIEALSRTGNEQEINDIREELIETGYVKVKDNYQKNGKQNKSSKKTKKPVIKFQEFTSSTGMVILAGKNNRQNDLLTMKTAAKSDIWMHAQKIQGAHVIIKTSGKEVDDATLSEAAAIAAYYSSGRDAGKIPVDYTLVKNVKKIPGGKPGMVTYTDYKTIVADASSIVI